MKKLILTVALLLLSACTAAVAAGCGDESAVVEKLPIESNMPIQNGAQNGSNQPNGGADESGDGNNGQENGDNETPDGQQPDPSSPETKPDGEPDTDPETPPEEVENIVVFVADEFEFTVPYSLGDTSVNEPYVPTKRGYSGKWQSYELSGGTITVNAEYELINYAVTFNDGQAVTTKHYTVFDNEVEVPETPQKKGYTAAWEDFTLTYGEPVEVNAVYRIIYYNIYFSVKGENVLRTYTVENTDLDEPSVPHKAGFTGSWNYGALTFGEDMFAVAEYTPLPATADGCFMWELNSEGNGYAVKEYVGTESEVVIPSAYNGLPVTEILRYAFSNNFTENGLTGVIISENVQKIGNYAFAYCSNLVSVELPSTLTEIGSDTFAGAQITEIYLPENLVKIGKNAFIGCALESVVIPESVEYVGKFAFKGYAALESAVFCDKENWFMNETSITSERLQDGATAAELLTTSDAEFIKNNG